MVWETDSSGISIDLRKYKKNFLAFWKAISYVLLLELKNNKLSLQTKRPTIPSKSPRVKSAMRSVFTR